MMAELNFPSDASHPDWRATKYVPDTNGRLRASRNSREVAAFSRLIADRVANFYGLAVPKYVRGDLLDLGCGKAPLLGLYGQYSESATLIDWGNSLHDNPHLDAIADLNEPLRLTSGKYGSVLLSDVLEHIKRPHELVAEIARVMAPGGVLLMNTPFMYGLHEQPHDYYRYTEFALTDIVTSAGLDVIELHTIGGALEVLIDTASKVTNQLPIVGSWVAALLQFLGGAFSDTGLGRRVTRRTSRVFPLGYGLVARKPG